MAKAKVTVKIDSDVLARVHDLIMARRGTPREETLAGFLQAASVDRYVEALELERAARGDPDWRFPRRKYKPRTGRPRTPQQIRRSK